MSAKAIIQVSNLLKITVKEAIVYCEHVRRASGLGTNLSYGAIAHHLRGKKLPYPEPQVLGSVIKQQESFRIRTGKRFSLSNHHKKVSTVSKPEQRQPRTALTGNITKRKPRATPLLDGIEVTSTELVKEFKHHVIDEHGFLVSTDMIPEAKMDQTEEKGYHRTASSKNVQPVSMFERIKAVDTKIPGARIKKIRPEPHQRVLCPICQVQVSYQDLFNHVTNRHREENAKLVLAQFNRQYEVHMESKSEQKVSEDRSAPFLYRKQSVIASFAAEKPNYHVNRIQTAIERANASEQIRLAPCPYCAARLKPTKLQKHLHKVHPGESRLKAPRQKLPKTTGKSKSLLNERPHKVGLGWKEDQMDTLEALRQSFDESRDGSKGLGHMRREGDGKFGSFPLHDDYGDEADAE